MKIVGLVGSPHGLGGNTGRLLKLVMDGAEEKGANTETIALKGRSVLPCVACDTCHKKGHCPQEDDFESIKAKILAADGLVLGSPNYISQVSAQLKAFFDRCCGIIHCLGFEGKYGACVVTSGLGDDGPIADYMSYFLITTGIRPVGSVWVSMGLLQDDVFPEDLKERARDLGRSLVVSWDQKLERPEVQETMAAFRERMKNLMLWRRQEWPYEYEYWEKNHDLNG